MQQKLFLLFISLVFIFTGCSQKRNSLNEYNLKGDVVKVYESTFEAVNKYGKWEMGDKENSGNNSMTFNESGYLTEYIDFDRNNKIDERQVVSYNENDNLSEASIYDSYGKQKSKLKYTNDSKSRLIKIEQYDADDKLNATYVIDYESSDKPIGGKYKNSDGIIESSWKNEWDGDFLKLQIQYDTLGKLDSKTYWERNDNSDVVLIKSTNAKDSVTSLIKISYEYDDQNNWTKKTVYDTDGKIDAFVTRRIIYAESASGKLNSKQLIGIWKESDNNDWWLEFKKDGSYDNGWQEQIKDFGKWEIDEEQKTLTLKSNEPGNSKKYSYSYEEQKLILSSMEGKDRTEYERR